MAEIPAYRVIIAGTIIFIVGLFIFSIIFQSYIVFQQFETQLVQTGNYSRDDPVILVLSIIPWGLGIFYISLIAVVIYFILRGSRGKETPPPPALFWR